MAWTLSESYLKTIVIGCVLIRQTVDLTDVRELGEKGTLGLGGALGIAGVTGERRCRAGWVGYVAIAKCYLPSWIRRSQGGLIDVLEPQQLCAVVAYVRDFQGQIVCYRPLNGECPRADV